MKEIKFVANPLKSPALSILLAVVLGPLGVLYTTTIGALVLLILFLICFGARSVYALALIWLVGCFINVIMTNLHNKKWLTCCKGAKHGCHDQAPSD